MGRPITTQQYKKAMTLLKRRWNLCFIACAVGLSEISIRRIQAGMFKLDKYGKARRKIRTHLILDNGKKESYAMSQKRRTV